MADLSPRDILLRVGGKTLTRTGIQYVAGASRGKGTPPVGPGGTFTRADASTCATFITRDGLVATALANILRKEWVDLDGDGVRETCDLLHNSARTNTSLRAQELDNATWTKTRSSITANATTAPDGTATMDKVVEDATASATHFVGQSHTITADENLAGSIFLKAGERTRAHFYLTDGGGTNGVRGEINLSTGTLTAVAAVGTGALIGSKIEALAGGIYRVSLSGSLGGGITAGWLILFLADAGGAISYTGNGTSGLYAWGAQLERGAAFASPYIPTVAGTVTRAVDALTVPCNWGPQADLTVLARIARPVYADAAGTLGVFPGWFRLGSGAGNIGGFFGSAARDVNARVDGGTDRQATVSMPAGAELVIAAQYKNLTTAGQAAIDVGSGYGAFCTATEGFSAYGSQTLEIGAFSGVPLNGGLIDLLIARNLWTRQEMMALS